MVDISVEVRPKNDGSGDLRQREPLSEKLLTRIEELGDSLKCIAEKLSSRLSEFETKNEGNWGLEEVEFAFSLDLEAEAGVIVARASTTAGFEAKLTWKKS